MEQKARPVFQMRLRPSDNELFEAIDAWRAGRLTGNREMSQAEAIRRLCRQSLRAESGLTGIVEAARKTA